MAIGTIGADAGERRDQWERLARHWRDGLEEASRNGRDTAFLDIGSLEELQEALHGFRAEGTTSEPEKSSSIVEKLSPAINSLGSFTKTIASASQYEHVSALLFSGLLAVLERGTKANGVVPTKVINLLNELCESIPRLEQAKKAIYQYSAIQYAFQDLFEDYMLFCTQACGYYSRQAANEPMPTSVYSRSPQGILEHSRSRIGRHVNRLRNAVDIEEQHRQSQNESEIAQLVPPRISDRPRETTWNPDKSSAYVQFPVNTVNRARNGAFVGRIDLLDAIAGKVSEPRKARAKNETPSKTGFDSLRLSTTLSHSHSEASSDFGTSAADSAAPGDSASEPKSSKSHAASLAENDKSGNTGECPTTCVLHGLGGVGKTQVALEYYYEHRGEYAASFWIDAEQDWTLASTFAKIADKLELLPRKTEDEGGHEVQNKAVEESRNWLQTTKRRWLLIMDNVEDFGDLGRYMPVEGSSNNTIIITTQLPTVPAWIENARLMPVKALDQETAASCIFKYLDREPEDKEEHDLACQIADHVGCLPLAMATIGGYVKQSQITLAEFFDNIKHKATLWERAHKIQEVQAYERSLITVFKKAFEDLTPAARELLNILAFLDPDSVPEEIFSDAIQNKRFKLIENERDLRDCYFELRSRQLIRRDTSSRNSYVSIHRTVQWNVLLDLSNDSKKRWECFEEAFNIVKAMLPQTDPKAVPEPEIWPPYARHGRQILELRTHCLWPEPPVELPLDFARILAEMGTYMWFSGKFPEGEKALGTAESILDDNKAKWNDSLRAHVYAMLGIITSFEGVSERKRSMEFRKKASLSRNQGIGRKLEHERTRDEDIMVWNMHSDIAYGFIQEEDFENTAKNMEDCLEQYKKWDTDEMAIPYEYAKYYQLMSFCLMADQRPVEAIKAITRCLELMEVAAGKTHSMTHLIKFCHANLLWHTEGAEVRKNALEINKAVLEHRKQVLGEFSHFTLESYSTCGKLCLEAGEVNEARHFLESCLQRRKRAVWNEEGITRAQFRYLNVLRALSKQAEDRGEDDKAKEYNYDAERRATEVTRIVERYRKEHEKYMPVNQDTEANLDQMVSIWAGRFTGGLKQQKLDLSFLPDDGDDHHPSKKRRLE